MMMMMMMIIITITIIITIKNNNYNKSDIARLRKDVSRLDDWFKGKWKKDKKRKKGELRMKYRIKVKGSKVVIEELKQ